MNETNDPGPAPTAEAPRADWDHLRQVPRIHRPRERMVGGVCAGLGRHFAVDPLVLRVAFAVLVFFGGAGLLMYGALWLMLPNEGEERATLHLDERSRTVAIVGVAVLATLALLGDTWGLYWFPWPLALLAVVGFVLYQRGQEKARTASQTPAAYAGPYAQPYAPPYAAPYAPEAGQPAPTAPTPTATAPTAPGATEAAPATQPVSTPAASPHDSPYAGSTGPTGPTYVWSGQAGAPVPPVAPSRPRDPRRRGPVLFWFTLALVALAMGVLGTVDLAVGGVVDSAYPALALTICAVMLLVGAFWGRAGGVILLALVAAVATAGSMATEHWEPEDQRFAPQEASQVEDRYEMRRGELTLDLTEVDDLDALDGRTIRLEGGAGRIAVVVPDEVRLGVDAEVGGPGAIQLPDGIERGGIALAATSHTGPGDGPEIDVEATLGVGEIEVIQR